LTQEDKVIKCVVESLSSYNPANTDNNGITSDGEFGKININTGSSVTLKFTLKDQLTDTEISLAGLYFTVYDLGMIFLFFFITINVKLVHKSCKFFLMDEFLWFYGSAKRSYF